MPIIALIYFIGVVVAFVITMPIGFYVVLEENGDDPTMLCLGVLGVTLLGACAAFAWPATLFFGPTYLYWRHQQNKERLRKSR
jgi:hypothetical protein